MSGATYGVFIDTGLVNALGKNHVLGSACPDFSEGQFFYVMFPGNLGDKY